MLLKWAVFAVVAYLMVQPTSDRSKPKPVDLYFMFFVRGDADRSKYSKEQLDKMQADHIGNLGAQHKLGKILAAGLLDENLPIRGIRAPESEGHGRASRLLHGRPFRA